MNTWNLYCKLLPIYLLFIAYLNHAQTDFSAEVDNEILDLKCCDQIREVFV